jgi:hypothetical protein
MSRLGDLLRGLAPDVTPAPAASTLAEQLQAAAPSRAVNWSQRNEVIETDDLVRILALPRRTPAPPPSDYFARFHRKGCGDASCPFLQGLRPIQATALYEASQVNGLLAPIGVGWGKTLISLMLPTVMESRIAVLMVPPSLKAQLLERDYPHLAQHWRIHNLADGGVFYPDTDGILHIVAYSELSSASRSDILDRINPDLIVADEAHALRHTSSARTKRFQRYFRSHPHTRLCALSGTLTSNSIKDYATLSKLALKDGSPLPKHFPTLEEWSWALDPSDNPAPPGALLRLCSPGESVSSGFRRRLVETPGVVATEESQLGTSLVMNERPLNLCPELKEALKSMRATWVTPGGEEITDALTFSRYARQLAAGFYYRWIWPRGESLPLRADWLEARKEWHREVRTYLQYNAKPGMDSPLLLARAADAQLWQARHWDRWKDIKDDAQPEVKAVWVSDFLVENAVEWAAKHTGIIWYEHAAVGEKIAKLGNLPLYGPGEEASSAILGEKGDRTIVVSVKAHGTGKNLQHFSTQLITTPSSNAAVWEQLLGRTHRSGQKADEVTAHIYMHTPETRQALENALAKAKYIQETTGQRQKLLYATRLY